MAADQLLVDFRGWCRKSSCDTREICARIEFTDLRGILERFLPIVEIRVLFCTMHMYG